MWIVVVSWIVFIVSFVYNRSRLRNSFYLMWCLFITLTMTARMFDEAGAWILVGVFICLAILIMSVPFLLMRNGIVMLKREGFAIANILSLGFGVVILLGEVAFLSMVFLPYTTGEMVDFWQNNLSGRLIALYGLSVFYISVVFVCFMVYTKFIEWLPHLRDFDFVIVHGAGLINGNQMSKLLQDRCDKALEVYRKDKTKPTLIASGGQGADETISEAKAMADYFLENGVDPRHIILEDQSPDTLTNLINSKAIIDTFDSRKRIALVSSNYHVYRCLLDARSIGLKCTGIGARVAFYYWPSALIREFIAVFSRLMYFLILLFFWLPILLMVIF